jgi:hypothetical protein
MGLSREGSRHQVALTMQAINTQIDIIIAMNIYPFIDASSHGGRTEFTSEGNDINMLHAKSLC